MELSPNKSLRLPVRRPTPSPPSVLSPQSLKVIRWGIPFRKDKKRRILQFVHLPDLRRILLDKQDGRFLFHQTVAMGDRIHLSLGFQMKRGVSKYLLCTGVFLLVKILCYIVFLITNVGYFGYILS